jgi:hypothetical protein
LAACGQHGRGAKSRNVETSSDDHDAMGKWKRIARQRDQIEGQIEQKETERAALSAEMNDPNFYLARKDAADLIKRFEQLGREIETLYADNDADAESLKNRPDVRMRDPFWHLQQFE